MSEVEVGEVRKIPAKKKQKLFAFHKTGSYVELAEAFRELLAEGYTQKDIARETGWSRAFVSSVLRILDLIPELREAARRGEIRQSVAWELSKLPPEEQRRYAEKLAEGGELSLKDVRSSVRSFVLTEDIMRVVEEPLPEPSEPIQTLNLREPPEGARACAKCGCAAFHIVSKGAWVSAYCARCGSLELMVRH